MHSRKLWRLVKIIVVIHLLLAIAAWFSLPPQIPMHFGANGKADAWGSTSLFSWFMFVAMSAMTSFLIYLITSPAAKNTWNIAEKKRFLTLTPEQQAPVFDLMRLIGAGGALCVNIVFLAVNLGVYLTATGHANGLPWWINIFLFGAPACLIASLFPWNSAVKRAILKASETTA